MYAQSHTSASASRSMPPESAFRHLVSQSGTVPEHSLKETRWRSLAFSLYRGLTAFSEGLGRREIITVRGQSCLASSKILTPHPPLRPASAYPPPLLRGEDTLAGWRGGWGVIILEDARHSSVLYLYRILFGLGILVARHSWCPN